MIDLTDKLEIYIITNGRSTFPYCHKAVEWQEGVKFKTTIHRDMDWLSANQKILDTCKAPFFMRVDDDMFLNPNAVRYMWHLVSPKHKRLALQGCRLWEPYSNKVCKGVKVYNLELTKRIGFRISQLGKIDKLFFLDARKQRLKINYTNDIVAIHGCSHFDEHLHYSIMRGEDKGPSFKRERAWMKRVIGKYNGSLDHQLKMAHRWLRRKNKHHKTNFYRFVKSGQ